MTKKKSPIDELFNQLYGYYPPKAGAAYEMIVAAAFKLLLNQEVEYDQRLRGNYSETMYQQDGVIRESSLEDQMIEAKDYTIQNKKVGRDDVQKLQGALGDLSVSKGVFASATNYTKPASKYSKSSIENPLHKEIELYDIRPSTVRDEEGRIKKIICNISIHLPNFEKGDYNPILTDSAREKAKNNGLGKRKVDLRLENFYDKNRNIILTLEDLTLNNAPGTTWEKDFISRGCWIINGFIDIEGELYEIHGLEYKIQFSVGEQQLIIEGGGEPKLYIKSHTGNIDKLITDKDLKKIKFEKGKVITK